jgi:hypothetical protein
MIKPAGFPFCQHCGIGDDGERVSISADTSFLPTDIHVTYVTRKRMYLCSMCIDEQNPRDDYDPTTGLGKES